MWGGYPRDGEKAPSASSSEASRPARRGKQGAPSASSGEDDRPAASDRYVRDGGGGVEGARERPCSWSTSGSCQSLRSEIDGPRTGLRPKHRSPVARILGARCHTRTRPPNPVHEFEDTAATHPQQSRRLQSGLSSHRDFDATRL